MRAALLLSAVLFLTACSKEPGDGGRAEIRGVVLMQNVSLSGNPLDDPFPAVDERVFIIYGDGQYHDDDTRTGPNGEFRFPWLRKGPYRVYAISECDNDGCREGVFRSAEIDGRRDIVNVPTITILRY
ncbi:MAG: DUF4198 domain-containing protein [Flavobacteriales bacterium]|jgi:hypothetical protein|nr:DUF4198 domain-containing protein [Flavobacteriales bacterium]